VWECSEGQTDTQACVTTVQFASAMPHMKCNNGLFDYSSQAVATLPSKYVAPF